MDLPVAHKYRQKRLIKSQILSNQTNRTSTPLTFHVREAAGFDPVEMQVALTVSPTRYLGSAPTISAFSGVTTTTMSSESVLVLKLGASPLTSH